jgi:hypothetical protein
MSTSCTDTDNPIYKEIQSFSTKEIINFFTENKGQNMKYVSLGEAMDFISGGGMNYVYFPISPKRMTKFTRTWMNAQNPRITYDRIKVSENVYQSQEKSRKFKYQWNKFEDDFPIGNKDLPRINYKECPSDSHKRQKHEGTVFDMAGRLRCSQNLLHEKVKEGFEGIGVYEDPDTATKRYHIYNETPEEDSKFNREEFVNAEEVDVINPCYSIIKEPSNVYLDLETILMRLNVYRDSKAGMAVPFSGFDLANYVKAWWKQPGEMRVWKKKHTLDFYNHFSDFQAVNSSD